jgi:hypothetical protein
MAVQTPDTNSRFDNVVGNMRCVDARFANVTASDTWNTGLGVVVNAQATAGNAAAEVTITGSSGIITFTNSGTTYMVRAVGF